MSPHKLARLLLAVLCSLSLLTVMLFFVESNVTTARAAPPEQTGGTVRYISQNGAAVRIYNDGQWYHLVMVNKNNTVQLYVNNLVVGTVTNAADFNQALAVFIGGQHSDANFNGSLDEVVIYDEAISAAEIADHYNNGLPTITDTHQQLLLRFNEGGIGPPFIDSTSQANNGTCSIGGGFNYCPSVVTGRFTNALSFDGDDFVRLVNPVDFARNDYTIEVWFKTTATQNQVVFSAVDTTTSQPGILVALTDQGTLSFLHRTPTGPTGGVTLAPTANDCTSPRYPCRDIQTVIDTVAESGDTLRIAAGRYSTVFSRTRSEMDTTALISQVVYLTKSLTLAGGYNSNFTASTPGTTILDGQNLGRAVYAVGDIDVRLEGFTLQNGEATGFGGHPMQDDSAGGAAYLQVKQATLKNNSIQNNRTLGVGGGVYVVGAENASFEGNTFTGNNAPTDVLKTVTVLTTPIMITSTSPPQIIFSTLVTETIVGTGGGVYAISSTVTFADNSFTGNLASVNGGAIYLKESDLLAFRGNTLSNNQAQSGGGLYLTAQKGTATLDGNTFQNNVVRNGDGGGVYLQTNAMTLTHNIIRGNQVFTGDGGGLFITGTVSVISGNTIASNSINFRDAIDTIAQGGGLRVETKQATIHNNRIQDNQTHGHGGGIYLDSIGELDFQGNIVSGNRVNYEKFTRLVTILEEPYVVTTTDPPTVVPAGPQYTTVEIKNSGGGLYLNGSLGRLSQNRFANNQAALDGGGLYINQANSVKLSNNLVVKNRVTLSSSVGSGLYFGKTQAEFIHNTVADNRNSDPEGVSFGMFAARDSKINPMQNNIIAHHELGIEFDDTSSAEGGSKEGQIGGNVWYGNTVKDWGTGGFKGPADHTFGDPQFIDSANGDYRILPTSVAFDTGVSTAIDTDFNGVVRPRGFRPDAGAYEQTYSRGLYLTQELSEGFVSQGSSTVFTLKLLNQSSSSLNNVQLSTNLPAQYVSRLTTDRGSCRGGSCTLNLGTLTPSDTVVEVKLTLVAQGEPPSMDSLVPLTNTVTVTFDGLDPKDSDTTHALATYLKTVYQPRSGRWASDVSASRRAARWQPPTKSRQAAVYTGQCSISMNGLYYPSIQAATKNSLRADDVVRVSGYCGEAVTLRAPKVQIEPWVIKIQGGWPSNSADMGEDFSPNPDLYPTTLDGGQQGSVIKIIGEFKPTFENVKITGGNASAGGGVYIAGSTVVLSNVHVIGNQAVNGGGVYIDELSSPTIQNSVIELNSVKARGGGLYVRKGGASIEASIIRNNRGASDGGGAYIEQGNPTFREVTFSGHTVSGEGGGIYLEKAPITMLDGMIENNVANAGGGVYAVGSAATFQGNKIIRNEARKSQLLFINLLSLQVSWVIRKGGGGGIFGINSGLTIEHNIIDGNIGPANQGAGIQISFTDQGGVRISGNVIIRHSQGAGVYLHSTPSVFKFYAPQAAFLNPALLPGLDFLTPVQLQQTPMRLRNNTFRFNKTALLVYGRTSTELINNIFSDNDTAIQAKTDIIPHLMVINQAVFFIPIVFPTFYGPKIDHSYTLFYQNKNKTSNDNTVFASINGSDEVSGNPYFLEDGYHIKRISAAFEAGKNIDIPIDIDKDPRPQGNTVDLGADEYVYRSTHYATPNPSEDRVERCTRWDKPCSLQAAIDAADKGDLVKLAVGTYNTLLSNDGPGQVAYINKSITLQGGYNPTDSSAGDDDLDQWEVPDPLKYPSIIDGGGKGRGIVVHQAGSKAVAVELHGLEVTNGTAAGLGGGELGQNQGGGLFVLTASVEISNVKIYRNQAESGGGVHIERGKSTSNLANSQLYNNRATRGAGLSLNHSKADLDNVEFRENRATEGGGLYGQKWTGTARTVRWLNNQATLGGGGYFIETGKTSQIREATLEGNQALRDGGGLYFKTSSLDVYSSTLRNNQAAQNGGGVALVDESSPNFSETLFKANRAKNGAGLYGIEKSNVGLLGTQLISNVASSEGGGLYIADSSPNVAANVRPDGGKVLPLIEANKAANGGGMYMERASGVIVSATLRANHSSRNGAGIHLAPFSKPTFTGVIIEKNEADLDGGGLYARLGDGATFENSILRNNTARYGAAGYTHLGKMSLKGNEIYGNQATLDGGGLYIREMETQADYLKNNIHDNAAGRAGGGLYITVVPGEIKQNVIQTNTAVLHGGGVYIADASPFIEENQILSNQAQTGDGGGLYLSSSYPNRQQGALSKNRVENNVAAKNGGAIFLTNSNPTVAKNFMISNTAQTGGAVYLVQGSAAQFENNVVLRNQVSGSPTVADRALGQGTAFFIMNSSPTLIHTTLNSNGRPPTGTPPDTTASQAAIYLTDSGTATTVALTNTIITSHTIGIQVALVGGRASLFNTVWFGNDLDRFGSGIINTTNDKFGDPNLAPNGYQLREPSVAIDQGLLVSGITQDINGNSRLIAGDEQKPDIGAVEFGAFCFVIVADTPATVYNVVQDAIDAAQVGDTVKVAGLCKQVSTRSGRTQIAYIDKNLTLQGGYDSADWDTFDPQANMSILDADKKGRPVYIVGQVEVVVEALSLINGDAGEGGGLSVGGGLYVSQATTLISKTKIMSSSGGSSGGGLFLTEDKSRIISSTIAGNQAGAGGGLYFDESQAVMTGSLVMGNQSTGNGGGMYVAESSHVRLTNMDITNNLAINGGGAYLTFSPITMTGLTMLGNQAQSAGGGIYIDKSEALLVDSLVGQNKANDGGGIYVEDGAARLTKLTVSTNTVAGNGGGLYIKLSAAQLNMITVTTNTAINGGGAYFQDSPATVNGVQLLKNRASGKGGGLFVDNADRADFTNNIVARNEAVVAGSGLYIQAAAVSFRHSTIVRNGPPFVVGDTPNNGPGSGIYIGSLQSNHSTVRLINTILLMHEVGLYAEADNQASLTATLWGNNSTVGGIPLNNLVRTTGPGKVTTAADVTGTPGFINFEADDYRIVVGSPAADVGVNAGVTSDFTGNRRPQGAGYDIGAAESVVVNDPGNGGGPTIQSNGNGGGAWDDPASWKPARVPNSSDVVKVLPSDTMTAPDEAINVKGLDNQGKIVSQASRAVQLKVSQSITNAGQIIGQNGQAGQPGMAVIINTPALANLATGLIKGGDGGDSSTGNGGDGGNAQVKAAQLDNAGTIKGGDGGASSSTNPSDSGGDGGAAAALAKTLTNSGTIQGGAGGASTNAGNGGDGGAATAAVTAPPAGGSLTSNGKIIGGDGGSGAGAGKGGDGGNGTAMSDGQATLDGGQLLAGKGGSPSGKTGDAALSGATVSASGPGTAVSGHTVKIAAAAGGAIRLTNLAGNAIKAEAGLTVAVAEGQGLVDLSNNPTTGGLALSATGGVTVATDRLVTGGPFINQIAGNNASQAAGGALADSQWVGPGPQLVGSCERVRLAFTVLNNGSAERVYRFEAVSLNNWTMGALPHEMTLADLSQAELSMTVVPSASVKSGDTDIITLKAIPSGSTGEVVTVSLKLTVQDRPFEPTLRAVQSGHWSEAATWQPRRVPTATDRVLIPTGQTVNLPSEVTVAALVNQGQMSTLHMGGKPFQPHVRLAVTGLFRNEGQFLGAAGQDSQSSVSGNAGSRLTLSGNTLCNSGAIVAGAGGSGLQMGGAGGNVTVLAEIMLNDGSIIGGAGGSVSGLGLGQAGAGGPVNMVGMVSDGSLLVNRGIIQGGGGGSGNPAAINSQEGGDGGAITLVADPELILNGGQQMAGAAGAGGQQGGATLAGKQLLLSGPTSRLSGQAINMMVAAAGLVDLSGLDAVAITADRVTVSAGNGAMADLRDNSVPAMTATLEVRICLPEPNILLDAGRSLTDVASDKLALCRTPDLYAHALSGDGLVTTPPGATLNLLLLLINSGVINDGYTVTAVDLPDSWQSVLASETGARQGFVDSADSASQQSRQLNALSLQSTSQSQPSLSVTVPPTVVSGTRQTVVVTATSVATPSHVATMTVEILVRENELSPTLQTIASGSWDDAAVWDENRVPLITDVVRVNPDHTVKLEASITVKGATNRGQLIVCAADGVELLTTVFMENYGQITGCDGLDGDASTPAQPGNSVTLKGGGLLNEGLLKGGACGRGPFGVVDAGTVNLLAENINHRGLIEAGACDEAENAGDVVLAATGDLLNSGEIRSGAGATLLANPKLVLDNSQLTVGDLKVGASQLSLANGQVAAKRLVMVSCEQANFNLSNLQAGAITAQGPLQVAVGPNSVINLSGNAAQVLQSPDSVTLATPLLWLGQGLTLNQVAGNNAVQSNPACPAAISLAGPGRVTVAEGWSKVVPLTALNLGAFTQTMSLTASGTATWSLELDDRLTVNRASSGEFQLRVSAPNDSVGQVNLVTIQAMSTQDRSVAASLRLYVTAVDGGQRLYLPVLVKQPTPNPVATNIPIDDLPTAEPR